MIVPAIHERVIPAQAGIQIIQGNPRSGTDGLFLSATQDLFFDWIPAYAGMTFIK